MDASRRAGAAVTQPAYAERRAVALRKARQIIEEVVVEHGQEVFLGDGYAADDQLQQSIAGALLAAEARVEQAEKDRDAAVAHDSQPYPTAHAYEQVCKALERARSGHGDERPQEKELPMTAEHAMAEIWGLTCPDCGPENYAFIVAELATLTARVEQAELDRDASDEVLLETQQEFARHMVEWNAMKDKVEQVKQDRDNFKRMYEEVRRGVSSGFLDRAEAAEAENKVLREDWDSIHQIACLRLERAVKADASLQALTEERDEFKETIEARNSEVRTWMQSTYDADYKLASLTSSHLRLQEKVAALTGYARHEPGCQLGKTIPSIQCPTCGNGMHMVVNSSVFMNDDQFDAVKRGDWWCGQGHAAVYLWDKDAPKQPCTCGLAAILTPSTEGR